MCGIVGYIGNRPVVDVLLQGLQRLEYRGYDSAGVAFLREGKIEVKKSEGKLENVRNLLNGSAKLYADSTCGIGHTRWATHGKPTTQNAHPHRTGHIVLVHNGIIENYLEIRKDLIQKGHRPQSETDSELFGFLVLDEMEAGIGLVEAVRRAFKHVEGACSVVVMSEREPRTIVGVRNGSPLVAGIDPDGGTVVASDAQPILQFTRDVTFLEHGDMVVGTDQGTRFFDLQTGAPIERPATRLDWSLEKLDKQGYPHYMLKEIHEQPVSFVDTLNGLLDRKRAEPFSLAEQPGVRLLERAKEIHLVACGTSWHAALLGKYWLEAWARIPVSVELASEFRYRQPVVSPEGVVIGISQSGETADTLEVIRQMRKGGVPTIAICNVRGSTMSREADDVFFTAAGPEIGVAATKTFSAQMLTLLVIAGYLGLRRGEANAASRFENLIRLPHLLGDYLDTVNAQVESAAKALKDKKGFFFIGRGLSYPIALEGALKLKEIAYIHAEGYAAGELKHGPIAMIDQDMVVVVLAPQDKWRDKTVSNLEEVKARGATILGVGAASDRNLSQLCDYWISLPAEQSGVGPQKWDEALFPFVLTPVVQLLSYRIAVLKGTDVDKPRNLAKSVTVE